MNTPGNKAKTRREELELSQKAVAKMVGISQPTLANFENGKNTRTKFLPELARALRMQVDELADAPPKKLAAANLDQEDFKTSNDGKTVTAEEITKIIVLYTRSTAAGRKNAMKSLTLAEKAPSFVLITNTAGNDPK